MLDPRPHLGEPPALDLLNTRWMDHGPRDLLTDVSGLVIWLDSAGLTGAAPVNTCTLDAVLAARAAIYDAVVHDSRNALNEVLDHGRVRRHLTADGPAATPEVDPVWLPGWLAADNLLTLLAEAPTRIRRCAHPDCVLFFYDTSKNGTRRWHSMATCGNRAKAARHHARRA